MATESGRLGPGGAVTSGDITAGGGMLTAIYDTDTDNVVDDSEALSPTVATYTDATSNLGAGVSTAYLDGSLNPLNLTGTELDPDARDAVLFVKCIDATNAVTIDPKGPDTIDGQLTYTMHQGESLILIPNGTNYEIVSASGPLQVDGVWIGGQFPVATMNAIAVTAATTPFPDGACFQVTDTGTLTLGSLSVTTNDIVQLQGTAFVIVVEAVGGFPPAGTRFTITKEAAGPPFTGEEANLAVWDGTSGTPSIFPLDEGVQVFVNNPLFQRGVADGAIPVNGIPNPQDVLKTTSFSTLPYQTVTVDPAADTTITLPAPVDNNAWTRFNIVDQDYAVGVSSTATIRGEQANMAACMHEFRYLAKSDTWVGHRPELLQLLRFDTAGVTLTHAEGQVYWDADYHTLALRNDSDEVTQQLGQEFYLHVYNGSGGTLTNGTAVYISSAQSHGGIFVPSIAKAQADAVGTAAAIGLCTHDIENTTYGWVSVGGLVNDVDTSSYSSGDELYLSATTAGGLTDTVPATGNYRTGVGVVVRSDASLGSIMVTPSTPVLIGAASSALDIQRNETENTHTGDTNWQQILTTGSISVPAGNIEVLISAEIKISNAAADVEIRLQEDNTTDIITSKTNETTYVFQTKDRIRNEATATTRTYDLDYRTSASSRTASIKYAHIIVRQLD